MTAVFATRLNPQFETGMCAQLETRCVETAARSMQDMVHAYSLCVCTHTQHNKHPYDLFSVSIGLQVQSSAHVMHQPPRVHTATCVARLDMTAQIYGIPSSSDCTCLSTVPVVLKAPSRGKQSISWLGRTGDGRPAFKGAWDAMAGVNAGIDGMPGPMVLMEGCC